MIKISIVIASTFLFILMFNPAPVTAGQPYTTAPTAKEPAGRHDKTDPLIARQNQAGNEQTLAAVRTALAADPENPDLMLAVAETLNRIMRIKTNGNVITIAGKTQDSVKNKAVWKTYAPEALHLSKTALKMKPDDPRALLAYAESYLYQSSSYGILNAIYKGAAKRYKENARNLIEKYPKADDALGHIHMGCFYLAAPWPLSSRAKARKHFTSALKLAPASVRGHYYVGLTALLENDLAVAEKSFRCVIDNPCTRGSEQDYCGFLKEQAATGLSQIKCTSNN